MSHKNINKFFFGIKINFNEKTRITFLFRFKKCDYTIIVELLTTQLLKNKYVERAYTLQFNYEINLFSFF